MAMTGARYGRPGPCRCRPTPLQAVPSKPRNSPHTRTHTHTAPTHTHTRLPRRQYRRPFTDVASSGRKSARPRGRLPQHTPHHEPSPPPPPRYSLAAAAAATTTPAAAVEAVLSQVSRCRGRSMPHHRPAMSAAVHSATAVHPTPAASPSRPPTPPLCTTTTTTTTTTATSSFCSAAFQRRRAPEQPRSRPPCLHRTTARLFHHDSSARALSAVAT